MMVARLLDLAEIPKPPDAADALALALLPPLARARVPGGDIDRRTVRDQRSRRVARP